MQYTVGARATTHMGLTGVRPGVARETDWLGRTDDGDGGGDRKTGSAAATAVVRVYRYV